MPDPVAVNSMFARIASRYDLANRLLSGGMDIWWRYRLVSAVRQGRPNAVLDLATGSGDVALALSRRLPASVQIIGMDFCRPMLVEADRKKIAAGPGAYANVTFKPGDALDLPAADADCDAVTISFGLRNFADRGRGLREIHRVLRPGGQLFVLEFSPPQRWFQPIYYFYLRHVLPLLAGWITGDRHAYDYLNDSIGRFPTRKEIAGEISAAGFSSVTHRGMTFGIVALHLATK